MKIRYVTDDGKVFDHFEDAQAHIEVITKYDEIKHFLLPYQFHSTEDISRFLIGHSQEIIAILNRATGMKWKLFNEK